MKIRIIVDSASDIAEEYHENLTVLPMTVTFGDEQYLDGKTISPKEFYEKLIESDELPTTSQIGPYDFEKAIRASIENGERPIVITVSSKLSGTYNSARIAAAEFDEEVPVIDSENVCIGERVLVEYALRLAENGNSVEEIVALLEDRKKDIQLIALLDTLEYLRKGGRISNVSGIIGGMLSIKPVVASMDGEIKVVGKARGSKNGNNLLTQKIEQCGGIDFSMPYTLGYSGLEDTLLKKYIKDSEKHWKGEADELPVQTVGATIGTHAGPGAIAVAFFSRR